jgi:hypothetical protein
VTDISIRASAESCSFRQVEPPAHRKEGVDIATPRRARGHLHGTFLVRAAIVGGLVVGGAAADDVGVTHEADPDRSRIAAAAASPVASADAPPLEFPAALRVTRSGERLPLPKATAPARSDKKKSGSKKSAEATSDTTERRAASQDDGTADGPVPAPPPEWNTAVREFGQALQFAWELTGSTEGGWRKLCQKFVRTALGLPATAESAAVSWEETPEEYKHTGPPPAGVPVYWSPNHVALSAGYGYVYSNDIRRKGKIDIVPIEMIEQKWGLTLLGWSSWMNGFELKPKPDLPKSIGTAVSNKR